MITKETIEKEFSLVESYFGNIKNYHNEIEFPGYGEFCDVYFLCEEKEKPNQNQIDILNDFKQNHVEKLTEIEKQIIKNLNFNNSSKVNDIKNAKLFLILFLFLKITQNMIW